MYKKHSQRIKQLQLAPTQALVKLNMPFSAGQRVWIHSFQPGLRSLPRFVTTTQGSRMATMNFQSSFISRRPDEAPRTQRNQHRALHYYCLIKQCAVINSHGWPTLPQQPAHLRSTREWCLSDWLHLRGERVLHILFSLACNAWRWQSCYGIIHCRPLIT